jgi:signal transduction histidine kinase
MIETPDGAVHLLPRALRVQALLGSDHPARRYGVALAATVLALLGVVFIGEYLHLRAQILLITGVVVSAWYGGRGPALLASALSVLAITVLIPSGTPAALDVPGVGEGVYLFAFLLVALVVGATTEALRQARAQADARTHALAALNAEIEQQMEEVQTLSEHLQESNESLSAALAAAEEMASRGMRLQEVTAALSLARTESEVADVVLGEGLAAVEGSRGFLARADGGRVEIFRAVGYAPEVEARLLDSTVPLPALARALRTGEPVWARSAEEHRAGYQPVNDDLGIALPKGSVSIPLQHGGEVVGALTVVFAERSAFSTASEAFPLLLGHAAAGALSRARSYDAERAARREAEMLAQARADVLGIVAHDLRNPLNLISTSTALLDEDDLPTEQRRKMGEITQRSVRQMNRLIGDLLDATRLRAGRLTLDLAEVDIRATLRQAEEALRPAAEQCGIELWAEPPGQETIVSADEGRLMQVIGNLVGNALKFTATGGRVVLSARTAGTEVVFSVADNGVGIPAEHMAHLFDRFWQARDGDRRGAGLGLAIARGIVQAHGGRMWVESSVGVGSTFSFAIPTAAPPSPE